MTSPLFETSRGGAKVVRFLRGPVSLTVGASGARFGFSARDELVEVVIEPELLARAQPF